jgi:hypothetical protein
VKEKQQYETFFMEGDDGGGGGPAFRFRYVVWNSYHDDVRAEVDRQKLAFAEDLGSAGVFEEPFESEREKANDRFRAKDWPDEVVARIEADGEPLILVSTGESGGFASFDPKSDPWAIIWLSDFDGAPYDVKPMFKALARKTRADDDVIEYLRAVALRRRRKEKTSRVASVFAHAGSYVEWKPTLPLIGVGIDVKAILADLASAARTRAT